jgi:hypothetical protein
MNHEERYIDNNFARILRRAKVANTKGADLVLNPNQCGILLDWVENHTGWKIVLVTEVDLREKP